MTRILYIILLVSFHTFANAQTCSYNTLNKAQPITPYSFYSSWNVFNLPFTTSMWQYTGNCSSTGLEEITQFTAPFSGNYRITYHYYNGQLPYDTGSYNVLFRKHNGQCDNSGYLCIPSNTLSSSYANREYTLTGLMKDTVYDILIELEDNTLYQYSQVGWHNFVLNIYPDKASNITITDKSSDNCNISWSCMHGCNGQDWIEYGPKGFIPGTDSLPGLNGTVIPNVSSPYNLSGLVPSTKYDVYIRKNYFYDFGENSMATFRTSADCSTSPLISCGTPMSYGANNGTGSWISYLCTWPTIYTGKENIYRFTAPTTGQYYLFCYSKPTNYVVSISVYYKEASGTCDENNWICGNHLSTSQPVPITKPFANLIGGNDYYIMADGGDYSITWPIPSFIFYLICANSCSNQSLTSVSSITSNSAIINAANCSCAGVSYLEYGPPGFIPGTDSLPGINGTVVSNVYFPYHLTGLIPDSTYDVYTRRGCSGIGYGNNSNVLSFSTYCDDPPQSINITYGNDTICKGDSIILTAVGGNLISQGSNYIWYKTQGQSLVGSGQSITLIPDTSSTYFVQIESGCGVTSKASINITMYDYATSTISSIGNPSLCQAPTLTLFSNNYSLPYTYQWLLNDTIINGAFNDTIAITIPGDYLCVITNSNFCSDTSSILNVLPGLPKPIINNSNQYNICPDNNTILTSSIQDSTLTFQWFFNNIILPGQNTHQIVTQDSGVYYLYISDSNCFNFSNSVNISIKNNIAATISTLPPDLSCYGEILKLKTIIPLNGSVEWLANDNTIPLANDSVYSIYSFGKYSVRLLSEFGCIDTSSYIILSGLYPDSINIEFQPDSINGTDALIQYWPTGNFENKNFGNSPDFNTINWTSGPNFYSRSLLKFDLNFLPAGSKVLDARLSLYYNNNTSSFINQHRVFSTLNYACLKRITTSWTENNITWNTQPLATNLNKLTLPFVISRTQNFLNLNVTNLTKDIIQSNVNNGLMLSFQDFQPNKSIILSSSDNENPILRPKLKIHYSLDSTSIDKKNISGDKSICVPQANLTYSYSTFIQGLTYNWLVPSNSTIQSGQGTNMVIIGFDSAYSSGYIKLVAFNNCTYLEDSILVEKQISTPSISGNIYGILNGCPAETKNYYINKISNADSYLWDLPNGTNVNGTFNSILTSDTLIELSFDSTFTGDSLIVFAQNCVGISNSIAIFIKNKSPRPPIMLSGKIYGLCEKQNELYELIQDGSATSSTWSTNILSASINGDSVYTSLSTNATISFPNFTTGLIYIRSSNNCGSSLYNQYSVNGTPYAPSIINGQNIICNTSTGSIFSVQQIDNTNSYNWSALGLNIINGQNTNTIIAQPSPGFNSGTLIVNSENQCGQSTSANLNINFIACLKKEINSETLFDNLYIFPTPAQDKITINYQGEELINATINIIDMYGKEIFNQINILLKPEDSFTIDLESITSGMYMIGVTSQNTSIKKPILVIKNK